MGTVPLIRGFRRGAQIRGVVTELSKDEAREESLRRWRTLVPEERETLEHAQVFAAALAEQLDFRTMGNARKVILGWLINEMRGRPAWGKIPPEGIRDGSAPG